ncbi:MAG: hypothetical protein JSS32_08415 [Verrucomicrobia bacterium]|nr:hypothetical protein [Verrucomicrobiota bacterium]
MHSIEVEQKILSKEIKDLPWFTGPLLAPSAHTVPAGSVNFEPYLYLTGYTGTYESDWSTKSLPLFWTYSFQFPVQTGITSWMDCLVSPIFYVDQSQGQNAWAMGDTTIGVGFQLCRESKYIPCIKLGFRETFPTGKYQHLDPKKFQTEAGGNGTFDTTIGLIFGKFVPISGIHYLNTRLVLALDIFTKVHVEGYNAYGGDSETKGTYYPPVTLTTNLGLEYSITQKWAFALDVVFICAPHSHFKGKAGRDPQVGSPFGSGTTPDKKTLAVGPSAQLSFAPAIEYNWSQYWGVIAGAWFTAVGKNTPSFQSGVIAINYFK